ncbi:MAG: NmrA family NAD(P)-binding protein [Chloroflexota bacterium]
MKKILVVGATGKIGREVVRELLEAGEAVRALTRSAARGKGLPDDVEVAVGDLGDIASLEKALVGITAVFFITPHDPQEEPLGRNLIAANERAGVERLVFASAFHPDSRYAWVRSLLRGLLARFTPHYLPKLLVDEAVRQSSIPSVVLMPSNFFQNDEVFRPEILGGRYPQPLGPKKISRVDCRDIGRAAARALTGQLAPGAYPLVNVGLSGPDCAAIWTEQLGRPVAYAGNDIDQWRQTVGDRMYLCEREDYAKTYGIMQRFGADVSKQDLARAEEAVGRPLISYEAYVTDCVNDWTSEK